MPENYDFKKEWEKTKEQLIKFSKEAVEVAKRGETEIIAFSQKGKLHIDATAATLKKEKLYYLIGKEYAGLKEPENSSVKLKKLMKDLGSVSKEQQDLKVKIKKSVKKTAKKPAKKASKKTVEKSEE